MQFDLSNIFERFVNSIAMFCYEVSVLCNKTTEPPEEAADKLVKEENQLVTVALDDCQIGKYAHVYAYY